MINKRFWNEIKSEWKDEGWYEYFGNPLVNKGRSCVYPEVPRVAHLDLIELTTPANSARIFSILNNNLIVDLEYLVIKRYEPHFMKKFNDATPINLNSYKSINSTDSYLKFKIGYKDSHEYSELCNYFGITTETHYHVPMNSFHKIVLINQRTHVVYLYPTTNYIF
ncbi:hypothetical protein RF11_00846 [Thelohanellus kitauei]|uniref:Alpha-1,3-mannosyl-glycoprotein 2-beta-N-acetylglucosaminyltransferase n=1 Tax=Thelohanellus kitauei TaxID=669202 RepID=A0A0C2N1H4_THEKT|nr:hypothetical protein RF11_00846 [Thelohanellus kitauei]